MMVDEQEEDKSSEQMGTTPAPAGETSAQIVAAGANQEMEAASSSSSLSSEEIDDDDFFQIEGPMLNSSQFSLSAAAAAAAEDGSRNAKQTPPVQATMSRASDESSDPKRIPSSVFARSKSTTPTDWSVTSNESLFSINVGNASFSKDHFFLYGKTGELGPNDPLAPLPPLPRQSPSSSSSPIKGEVATKDKPSTPKEEEDGRGLAGRNGEENPDCIHSFSHRSDGSTSFAFPMYETSATLYTSTSKKIIQLFRSCLVLQSKV
ncbi:hypothetical protein GUJ93_ZPchr0013g34288 [Zizania palustris]|uniref:Uncharacterized protein n=1 Tax=Zizania palustris TaxID=103762 RepID=A0A8J6C1U0_ZIZPA|nr:hypothetical protein GUJ93_ZPchr0013g34288 [Zizania palustris]KAG8100106.1 hypothetical protein GUJ93_ZPchr0013g34288 [Zizania palustris]